MIKMLMLVMMREESFGVEKFHVPAILYYPVFSTDFCYVLHAH